MKETLKRECMKVVKKMAFTSAQNSVNQTCIYIAHQPKLPEQAKKLKKNG